MVDRVDGEAPARRAGWLGRGAGTAAGGITRAGNRHLYIAWVTYQRRAESMRDRVGYSLHHVPPPFQHRLLKPFGYVLQALSTLAILRRERPDVVWVQLPPTFILHVLLLGRVMARPRFRLVADCHNGVFQTWWRRVPLLRRCLNGCDLVLAHNAEVAGIARDFGVDDARLVVLETRPAQIRTGAAAAGPADDGVPAVLVPCSFDYDEPVELIVDLARAVPEVRFHVTGRRRKAEARGLTEGAPDNLVFTDYLSVTDYNALLMCSNLVLGLTSVEGVQLSVANEAVGAGKAMVLSDTAILRELFGRAARLARNEAAPMAAAVRTALGEQTAREALSRELREFREARWQAQIGAALDRLVAGSAATS